MNVPAELAVAGSDNIDLSAYLEVPPTTAAQPTYDMGRSFAALLCLPANAVVAPEDRIAPPHPEMIVRPAAGRAAAKRRQAPA